MAQPDLGARLEAAAAQLVQLDNAAAADALLPEAAARFAHTAQDLLEETSAALAAQQARDACQAANNGAAAAEGEARAAQLCGAASSMLNQLAPLLRALSARLEDHQQPLSEHAADLWLLLAASELLRACAHAASVGALDQQQLLRLAQAACGCLLSSHTVAAVAAATARSGGGFWALDDLMVLLNSLLQLASLGISTVQQLGADAAELAPPGETVVRLAAVVKMARLLGQIPAAGRELRMVLPSIACILHRVAQCPAWGAHAHAVAAHERLASDALTVLMPFVGTLAVSMRLPADRRPPGCTWQAAGWVSGLVTSGMFADALDKWAHGADGASTAAAVAAAAQLAQQVPLEGQPGPAAVELWHAAALVAALPGHLCVRLCQNTALLDRLGSEQQRRTMEQLLSATSRLPQLLQRAAGSEQGAVVHGTQLQALIGLCPAAKCQLMLLSRTGSATLESSSGVSTADAAAWASAAGAALRCTPLLHELHSTLQQDQHSADADVAAELVFMINDLLRLAAMHLIKNAVQLHSWPEGAAADAGEALRAAWELHTKACRHVHSAAAASSTALLLAGQPVAPHVVPLLCSCMVVARLVLKTALGASGASDAEAQGKRQLRAMSVAHWQTLAVCGAHASLVQLGRESVILLPSLVAMMGAGPLALSLDRDVQQLFKQLWGALPQQRADMRSACMDMVTRCGMTEPGLTAVLASGYLQTILDEAAAAPAQERSERLQWVLGVLLTLEEAARPWVASQEPSGGSNSELLKQLQHNLAFHANLPSLQTIASVEAALPSAARLAAALLDWWRRPGAQQEQQLEAAQAAAGRSCAYLCCANLGGGGGPAAGQGEHSQRCSACRAVWYCGTACSHADWRAGHKRVCKALGAARAAAKAARRQAAEGAGAADAPAA